MRHNFLMNNTLRLSVVLAAATTLIGCGSSTGAGGVGVGAGGGTGGGGTGGGGTGGGAGTGGGGATGSASDLTASGGFTATVSGDTMNVDYTNMTAKVTMTHRLDAEAQFTCVPSLKVEVSTPVDYSGVEVDACTLELHYAVNFDAKLVLESAYFHAKKAIKQGDVTIGEVECPGWNEPANGEVVYALNGDGPVLDFGLLTQPEAGMATATLKDRTIAPTGTVEMKFKGRKFNLDLGGIAFSGNLTSTGSTDVQCKQDTVAFPEWQLEDINPNSPTFGAVQGLEAYYGKRLVVLFGAGWCNSCRGQAEDMEKMLKDMASKGETDVAVVMLHDVSAANPGDQQQMITRASYPIYQCTGAANGWSIHGAAKNDAQVFYPDGRLKLHWEMYDANQTPQTGSQTACASNADCTGGGFKCFKDGFCKVPSQAVFVPTFENDVRAALAEIKAEM